LFVRGGVNEGSEQIPKVRRFQPVAGGQDHQEDTRK